MNDPLQGVLGTRRGVEMSPNDNVPFSVQMQSTHTKPIEIKKIFFHSIIRFDTSETDCLQHQNKT